MPISIDYQCIFDTLKLILFGGLVALNKTLVFLLKTNYCGTKFFYLCTFFGLITPVFYTNVNKLICVVNLNKRQCVLST